MLANDVVSGRHDNHYKLALQLWEFRNCIILYMLCVLWRSIETLSSGSHFAWLLHVNDSCVLF